jgi:hypothetical protein
VTGAVIAPEPVVIELGFLFPRGYCACTDRFPGLVICVPVLTDMVESAT